MLLMSVAMAGARELPDAANPANKPGRDLWFGKDKADHLVVSAFLTGFGYYAARKEMHFSDPGGKNAGACFSISLGLMKEVHDKRRPRGMFSLKDLGADILGIGLGYLICSAGGR
jgi:uncharacterized protein YfiM (DUF2279 family)